jgi:hypothetical protein
MNAYLASMNLSQIVDVASLTVVAGNALGPIDISLTPSFLPDLQRVRGDLLIQDLTQTQASAPRLQSLPGLVNLAQVGGSVQVTGTAFPSLASLAGLQCVGGPLSVFNNTLLTTLNGLEKLSAVTYATSSTTTAALTVGLNPIASPTAVAPLTALARCTDGTSTVTTPVVMTVTTCPATLTTWTGVCQYIASGACTK